MILYTLGHEVLEGPVAAKSKVMFDINGDRTRQCLFNFRTFFPRMINRDRCVGLECVEHVLGFWFELSMRGQTPGQLTNTFQLTVLANVASHNL